VQAATELLDRTVTCWKQINSQWVVSTKYECNIGVDEKIIRDHFKTQSINKHFQLLKIRLENRHFYCRIGQFQETIFDRHVNISNIVTYVYYLILLNLMFH
jgi:hypothetical protein